MRIAVGGLHTECSTWNPVLMQTADFRVLRGADLLTHAEFAPLRRFDVEWMPLLHARAVPGGPISRATYAAFKTEFLKGLAEAGKLDGLYLAMHGACFVEGMEDVEGDWIQAARAVVGPDCPIAASYDLHGNITQRVIDGLDILANYRTAPHIDVDETKTRAVEGLCRAIREKRRPFLGWISIPVLLPGERTSTQDEPAASLYAALPHWDSSVGIDEVALFVGYVWADEARSTACVVVTGTDAAAMRVAAEEVAQSYWWAREAFTFCAPVDTIEGCVTRALQATTAPVVIADSGDNPTGGGVGDRADVLARLIAHAVNDAMVVGIADPPATHACYAAGIGAMLNLSIGASLDPAGSVPVRASATVKFLLDTADAHARLAVVTIGGIEVVLSARRRPFHEIADFTRLRLDPRKAKLLVVKSGYLAPAIAEIANPNLMALSPGVVNQDIAAIPIRHIPRPVFPWDRDFDWAPQFCLSARCVA